MAMNLHPPSFIESAGGCEGPRYVRSQPSRETAGVLLNECQSKYIGQFDLPQRNISRYVEEMSTNWDKLSKEDKELVTQDIVKHIPDIVNDLKIQTTSPTILSFLRDYVSLDPTRNTKELLNAMYNPSDTIKTAIPNSKMNEIKNAVDSWSGDQCVSFHINMKTIIITSLLLFLFFVLGAASCKGLTKK
jgi:hypothetical protein